MDSVSSSKQKVLLVELDRNVPADLFSPRSISTLAEISDEFWNQSGRIYLLTTEGAAGEALKAHGAEVDRHGTFIRRDSSLNFAALDRYLPHVAKRTITPRLGDLIPATSWGSSLCNMLTKASWETIRQETFASTGGRCEICGMRQDMECHEEWEYHEPNGVEKVPEGFRAIGVQRLVRLIPLCDDCHETYHLGFANVSGRLESRLSRIAGFNRFGVGEISRYYKFIGDRWTRRNRHMWALDVSVMSGKSLVVKPSWVSDGQTLTAKAGTDNESNTMLLGAKWRYAKDKTDRPETPADSVYFQQ